MKLFLSLDQNMVDPLYSVSVAAMTFPPFSLFDLDVYAPRD